MSKIENTVRSLLLDFVEDIDNNTSNLNEDEWVEIASFLQMYRKYAPMTRYQACQFLGISKSKFDELITSKVLPKGEKLYTKDSKMFWRKSDLENYKNNKINEKI